MPILAWSQPCKEIALLKGLRRVSRSGKFSQSFIFSTKMIKKSRFSSKDFNFKNPNTIYLRKFEGYQVCFHKNDTSWTCRSELCSLTKKNTLKHKSTDQYLFVLKSRYSCLFWVLFDISKTWINLFFRRNPVICDLWFGARERFARCDFQKRTGESSFQFPRNFVFLAKIRRKIRFFVRRFQFQRFKLGFLDSSKYSTSTNSRISKGTIFVFKKITKYFPCRTKYDFQVHKK
jgi:hypothetical protein